MCSPSTYTRTLKRSHKLPLAGHNQPRPIVQDPPVQNTTWKISWNRANSHQHPHFTDGETEAQRWEWACPSPLFSQAVTDSGPDRSPDRQPSPLSSPPRLMFQTAQPWRLQGEGLAAGSGESQIQITAISQAAKKKVETILPCHPQVARLQKATENAGRLTSLRKTSTSNREGKAKISDGPILTSSCSSPQPFLTHPQMTGKYEIPSACNLDP